MAHENQRISNVKENYNLSFKCDQCTFASVWANNLKSHMKIHSKNKSFKCNQYDFASAHACQQDPCGQPTLEESGNGGMIFCICKAGKLAKII